MGVIYMITNIISNKMYIGQTTNYSRRKCEHISRLKHHRCDNIYMQLDCDKYGLNTFEFSILEDNVEPDKLLEVETYWINQFGGINSENLYNEKDINGINYIASNNISNSLRGSNNGMYGKHHSDKAKSVISRKVSEIKTGVKRSDEFKAKMSKIRKENPVKSNTGKRKYDEEFIRQLRAEYAELKSYKGVYILHPNICSQTINHLIRFGTSQYPKTYK